MLYARHIATCASLWMVCSCECRELSWRGNVYSCKAHKASQSQMVKRYTLLTGTFAQGPLSADALIAKPTSPSQPPCVCKLIVVD
jgi:hypothetical protein